MTLCRNPKVEDPDHEDFIEGQMRQALRNADQGYLVSCRCGATRPLRFLYRCFYCLELFCGGCAEQHFGASRAEYYADPLARWKLTFAPTDD